MLYYISFWDPEIFYSDQLILPKIPADRKDGKHKGQSASNEGDYFSQA
jgi:hypothetical protein